MKKIKELGELKIVPSAKLKKLYASEKNQKIKAMLEIMMSSKNINDSGSKYKDFKGFGEYKKIDFGDNLEAQLLKAFFKWDDEVEDEMPLDNYHVRIYDEIRSEVMTIHTENPNFSLEFIDKKMKKYKEAFESSVPENTPEWADKYREKHRFHSNY